MTDQIAKTGYAKGLQFLQALHQQVKKSGVPEGDLPTVTITSTSISVTAWVWARSFRGTEEEQAEQVRVDLEERIARLVDLFPGAAWVKNDPTKSSFDDSYYKLNGKWENVSIVIYTARAAVCERVVVMTHTEVKEVPDPEFVAEAPMVTVTEEKEIVEWQCNSALARKTSPLQAVTV